MPKRLAVIAALLLLSAAGPARAAGPLTLQVGGGAGFPSAPEIFPDFWELGFNLKGAVGLSISPITGFDIMGKIEYHSFPFDWNEAGIFFGFPDEGFDGGDLRALLLGADARFRFGPPGIPLIPYLFAGGGYADLTTSDLDIPTDPPPDARVPEEVDESEFYLNAGLGVAIRAGPSIAVFIEARFVNIFMDGDDIAFVPITAGITF